MNGKLDEEILEIQKIEKELDTEITKPYADLNWFCWCLSKLLLKRTFEAEGTFHQWVSVIAAAYAGFTIAYSTFITFFFAHSWLDSLSSAWFGFHIIWMWFQMHIAYNNEENITITHPIATAKNYIKTR